MISDDPYVTPLPLDPYHVSPATGFQQQAGLQYGACDESFGPVGLKTPPGVRFCRHDVRARVGCCALDVHCRNVIATTALAIAIDFSHFMHRHVQFSGSEAEMNFLREASL